MDAVDHPPLVPGRTCGSCNVCCVALTIVDPALQKPQGIRCQNAASDNSCTIYDTRPNSCRTFYCGWRILKWIREPLRPDQSGVLVRLEQDSVVFTILEDSGLAADGFAESIGAAVNGGIPTFFEVPSRPGWTSGLAQVNHILEQAVRDRDKPSIVALLQRCLELGRTGGSAAVKLD